MVFGVSRWWSHRPRQSIASSKLFSLKLFAKINVVITIFTLALRKQMDKGVEINHSRRDVFGRVDSFVLDCVLKHTFPESSEFLPENMINCTTERRRN